jgi:hypothetical protein
LRIAPWGRKLLVADYGRHTVECLSEEGEPLGNLYFPYVSGVKWTLDERVLLSSGKYPQHTFLLLITGALHTTAKSGWFGYVMDYGTQASNRADAFYLDRVLIQWYLGFSEISLPLPKTAPYVVRVGSGEFAAGDLVKEQGFDAFTPILVFNEGHVVARPKDVDLALEVLVPHHPGERARSVCQASTESGQCQRRPLKSMRFADPSSSFRRRYSPAAVSVQAGARPLALPASEEHSPGKNRRKSISER